MAATLLLLCITAYCQTYREATAIAPDLAATFPATVDLTQLPAPRPYVPAFPWEPPAPRMHVSSPFAPLFLKGNDIFRGDREAWVSNAILELEGSRRIPEVKDWFVHDYIQLLGSALGEYSHDSTRHYTFTVLDSFAPNAFDAGNGRIFVSLGMLQQAKNEDELAGILAHEIGRDNFHHIGRTMTRELFWMNGKRDVKSEADTREQIRALFARYRESPFAEISERLSGIGRMDESAADKAAFYNVYRAGYNPLALADLFGRRAQSENRELIEETTALYPVVKLLALVLDSHPPSEFRSLAMRWESNFVNLSERGSFRTTDAFRAMQEEVTAIRTAELEAIRRRRAERLHQLPVPR